MKSFWKGRGIGFYFLLLAGVLAVASFLYYLTWARANYAVSTLVLVGLGAGFALNVLILFFDSDYLVVGITVGYSVALCQLLVDSVGSFADAYQGIVMFGDPTQVGTIIRIGLIIGAGVLASIVSGFVARRKAIT